MYDFLPVLIFSFFFIMIKMCSGLSKNVKLQNVPLQFIYINIAYQPLMGYFMPNLLMCVCIYIYIYIHTLYIYIYTHINKIWHEITHKRLICDKSHPNQTKHGWFLCSSYSKLDQQMITDIEHSLSTNVARLCYIYDGLFHWSWYTRADQFC